MMVIPENLTEFLFWVKQRTEAFWSRIPQAGQKASAEVDWLRGAKWVGLEEAQIDEIEKKYCAKFTPDHREFLKILHTLDRKCIITNPDQFPEGTEVFYKEVSFFYDWLTDEEQIKERLYWPYRTIQQDVEGANKVWLKSWGKRPETAEEREVLFAQWYKQAPKLLPLTSHRFLVSEPLQAGNPVLSIWGSDIIVYGWNLRSYLINELESELDLLEQVFDEEDQEWYPQTKKEAREILDRSYATAVDKQIPYWEEMILYWSSGWSSFGRKFSYPSDSRIQPIIKADTPKEDKSTDGQKTFNDFT